MDNIKVDMDGPYEDEAALAVLNPWSFFHCLHFPEMQKNNIKNPFISRDFPPKKKTNGRKPICDSSKQFSSWTLENVPLKKPPNTARIPAILEVFPDAKFIHIYRSPYLVYLSTKKMRLRVLDKLALQEASEQEIEQQVLSNYIRLMNSFFEQKEKIQPGRFVEIRYEDLIKDPMKHIQYIYDTLHIPGSRKQNLSWWNT